MNICQVSTVLAYSATIYIIASIIYIIITRSYGTPFSNAVKKYPELMKIKLESASKRKSAFCIGTFIGIISLIIIKPFGNCW